MAEETSPAAPAAEAEKPAESPAAAPAAPAEPEAEKAPESFEVKRDSHGNLLRIYEDGRFDLIEAANQSKLRA